MTVAAAVFARLSTYSALAIISGLRVPPWLWMTRTPEQVLAIVKPFFPDGLNGTIN